MRCRTQDHSERPPRVPGSVLGGFDVADNEIAQRVQAGGPAALDQADRKRFADQLDRLLRRTM